MQEYEKRRIRTRERQQWGSPTRRWRTSSHGEHCGNHLGFIFNPIIPRNFKSENSKGSAWPREETRGSGGGRSHITAGCTAGSKASTSGRTSSHLCRDRSLEAQFSNWLEMFAFFSRLACNNIDPIECLEKRRSLRACGNVCLKREHMSSSCARFTVWCSTDSRIVHCDWPPIIAKKNSRTRVSQRQTDVIELPAIHWTTLAMKQLRSEVNNSQ